MPSTDTKIALVTGANKGIGFEIARQLGKAGCTVMLGARNPELGREAAARLSGENMDVRLIQIDVDHEKSILDAAATIAREFGRLDILVNNAGIADREDGPPSTTNLEAVERTLRTNFVGALRVTQAMLPLLRKAPFGRIVNVSSGLGSLDRIGDPDREFTNRYLGYSASKTALNMLTVQLARELGQTGIKVNSVDPGYTATDLNQHRGYQTVEQGAAEPVRLALLSENGPTGGFFSNAGRISW